MYLYHYKLDRFKLRYLIIYDNVGEKRLHQSYYYSGKRTLSTIVSLKKI